jgi:hypothetical protein
MIFWTHIYDAVLKAGFWLLAVIVAVNSPYFEDSVIEGVLVSTLITIAVYVYFLRTLGSYLYCRFTLNMKFITFDEAKALNEALSPNPFPYFDKKWLPLKEVKSLPELEKYSAALNMLERWTKERKQKWQDKKDTFNNSPVFIKVLDVLTVIVCLGFLATSILDLPPASYVIRLYCHVFDTNQYSPMLIGMLMTLVVVLPVFFYKRSRGIIK